jgi:hypothetical protein
MVAASISVFHRGRRDILLCSVCVRQVTGICGMGFVWVSNLILPSLHLKYRVIQNDLSDLK